MAKLINIVIVLLIGFMICSCATIFKGTSQSLVIDGSISGEGLVLKSSQPMFVHTKTKKVTTNILIGNDGSKVENISTESTTKITWLPPDSSSVELKMSSRGKIFELTGFCDCSLKDKGKRLHSGAGGAGEAEVYLEPDCKRKQKGNKFSVNPQRSGFYTWINLTNLGLGLVIDYYSGALYDYPPTSIKKICSSRSSKKSKKARK